MCYHGKTLGALSLTPNDEYQGLFKPLWCDVLTLPYGGRRGARAGAHPARERGRSGLCRAIQGEGGVITYRPPEFLPLIGELAQQYGFLVVADEIQNRVGALWYDFASVALGLEPDILTLAQTARRRTRADWRDDCAATTHAGLLGGLSSKRHSNTFGGGSLAMAVGLKSLELIEDEGLSERSRAVGTAGVRAARAARHNLSGLFWKRARRRASSLR